MKLGKVENLKANARISYYYSNEFYVCCNDYINADKAPTKIPYFLRSHYRARSRATMSVERVNKRTRYEHYEGTHFYIYFRP